MLAWIVWTLEEAQIALCAQAPVNTRGCCSSHNVYKHRAMLLALQTHCSAFMTSGLLWWIHASYSISVWVRKNTPARIRNKKCSLVSSTDAISQSVTMRSACKKRKMQKKKNLAKHFVLMLFLFYFYFNAFIRIHIFLTFTNNGTALSLKAH